MTLRIMDCGVCYLGKAHLEEIDDRLIGSCQHCGAQFNVSATPMSTNDIPAFMEFLANRLIATHDEKPDIEDAWVNRDWERFINSKNTADH